MDDLVTYHRIWSETDRRLDALLAQVREGVNVDEASNFSRWLTFSGILGLLSTHEQEVPLPIRALDLKRKCDVLTFACGEWYSLHATSFKPRDAYVSQSKLDAIEGHLKSMSDSLKKLSAPMTEITAKAGEPAEPALQVFLGAA
jgi:hypothetical protein